MLGLVVISLISWGMLHLFEKENLGVLGVFPLGRRLLQFSCGLAVMALIVVMLIYVETISMQIQWQHKPVDFLIVLQAFYYHLRSALTEDLVFRGALLYILIKRLGASWAMLISALVFGGYHWFSYGILQERIILLIYVFLVTGVTGWVWAYSFYKTKSIMLGLGLHVSYNLVMSFFYESKPYGELVFTQLSQIDLTGWDEFNFSMFRGFFPSVCTFISLKLMLSSSKFKSLLSPSS